MFSEYISKLNPDKVIQNRSLIISKIRVLKAQKTVTAKFEIQKIPLFILFILISGSHD
jgi:hypothetical protein